MRFNAQRETQPRLPRNSSFTQSGLFGNDSSGVLPDSA